MAGARDAVAFDGTSSLERNVGRSAADGLRAGADDAVISVGSYAMFGRSAPRLVVRQDLRLQRFGFVLLLPL
jgi:hypothetical protein